MPVAVVIPTHRRPEALGRCLAALAEQAAAPPFQVVVVDNRNPPGEVDAAVRPWRSRLAVTVIAEGIPGPAAARNAGTRAALFHGATLVAFTDDDCVPDRGWLAAMHAAHMAAPEALLGGRTIDAEPRGLCAAASRLVLDYFCAQANADAGDLRFFPSNNLAVPTARLVAAGGFDARFAAAAGEDRDFCDRWRAGGGRLAFVPEAVVTHAHPLTLAGFLRQQAGYGRGAFRFHATGTGRGMGSPGFYAGLLASPFRQARAPRSAALAGLVALSQAAVAAGYFSEMARGGLKGLRSGD